MFLRVSLFFDAILSVPASNTEWMLADVKTLILKVKGCEKWEVEAFDFCCS